MAEHATLGHELERRRLQHRADRLRKVLDALDDRRLQRSRNAKGLHEAERWFRRELARVSSRQAELDRLA